MDGLSSKCGINGTCFLADYVSTRHIYNEGMFAGCTETM